MLSALENNKTKRFFSFAIALPHKNYRLNQERFTEKLVMVYGKDLG